MKKYFKSLVFLGLGGFLFLQIFNFFLDGKNVLNFMNSFVVYRQKISRFGLLSESQPPSWRSGNLGRSGGASSSQFLNGVVSRSPTFSATDQEERERLKSAILSLQSCYESQDCDFPQTDPHSYEFAVGRALSEKLRSFWEKYGKDQAAQEDLKLLAYEFIRSEDGFVQSAALDMFSSLPPMAEHLLALTESLQDSSDPDLIEQSLQECKRYLGSADETLVHQYLGHVLESGAHFASQRAALGLGPFLNLQSYARYGRILERLSPDSTVARNLKSKLNEFNLQNSGS